MKRHKAAIGEPVREERRDHSRPTYQGEVIGVAAQRKQPHAAIEMQDGTAEAPTIAVPNDKVKREE